MVAPTTATTTEMTRRKNDMPLIFSGKKFFPRLYPKTTVASHAANTAATTPRKRLAAPDLFKTSKHKTRHDQVHRNDVSRRQ